MAAKRAITRVQDADDVAAISGNDGKWLRLSSGAFVFATPTYTDVGAAAASHTHAAADIASGTIAQARLGSGSGGAGAKALYDDQTYKTPPSLASDTLWDANGDLAIGTGADAATRLPVGSAGQQLGVVSGRPAWVGSEYSGFAPPSGALAENFSRFLVTAGSAATSGTLKMTAIWLPAGLTVTSINLINGSTAEAGGTHTWAALYDSSRNLLRQSTDETGAAAIAGSVAHTFTLTSTYTTTTAGLYYVGVLTVASTMPVWLSLNASQTIQYAVAPILTGNSTGSLTGTAPDPAGAITVGSNPFYCYVA